MLSGEVLLADAFGTIQIVALAGAPREIQG
jgi:hypothetical protein